MTSETGFHESCSTFTVRDICGRPCSLPVDVWTTDHLCVRPRGYGDYASSNGRGVPILLELYNGRLYLIVYADIHSEHPTHEIDMEGAREERRSYER